MSTVKLEGNLRLSNVVNADVASAADIDATKLQHQYQPVYAQNGTASAVTVVLHRVRGATAELVAFHCGSVVAAVGDSTVTIDFKKNGTTVLTATVQLDSGNSAYVAEAAAITTSTAVAADVYTAVITVSAGTGTLPTGLYVTATIREKASP